MWHRLDTCDSTNREADKLASTGCPEGTVVVAAEQTAGRGRRGRTWHSPRGGLWFTVVLRPPHVEGLSLVAGLACHQALPVPTQLHWPNDLYAQGKKLGGILVESRLIGPRPEWALVGIGVNANNEEFPADVPGISLSQLTGKRVDEEEVLHSLVHELDRLYRLYKAGGLAPLLPRIRAACAMIGQEVEWEIDGQTGRGKAVDLTGEGALKLEDGTVLSSVERIRAINGS